MNLERNQNNETKSVEMGDLNRNCSIDLLQNVLPNKGKNI